MNRHSSRRRGIVLTSLSLFAAALTLVIAVASVAGAGPRVLHFPPDKSLGTVSVQDANQLGWDRLGPAQGDVTIPEGKRVSLDVSGEAFENLAAIESLGPDDLYRMSLSSTTLCDEDLKHICRLTGLQQLTLSGARDETPCPFTGRGLQYLKDLRELRNLYICQSHITDENFVHLASLPSLEALMFYYDPNVGGPGLRHLQACPNLRTVVFYHTPITGNGLVHLAGMDQLEVLGLQRTKITEDDLAFLKDMKHLKDLTLSENIGDTGLEHVASLVGLEQLRCDGTNVSDEFLSRLQHFTKLRRLEIQRHHLDEKTGAFLQEVPNLEELILHLHRLDDKETRFLPELPHLVGIYAFSQSITDAGLANFKGLRDLRDLRLEGMPITDAGLAYLSELTSLQRLFLDNTKVTDAGLVHLTDLTSLDSLYLSDNAITGAGLDQLSHLPKLKRLVLSKCPIENTAIQKLAGMSSLNYLGIQRTYIDEEGLEQLKEALPHCEIGWTIPRVKLNARAPEIASIEFIQAPSDAVATWDALKGNVVVVEFWATWCGPCVQSIPHLNELVDHFQDQPVRFISVTDEEETKVKAFLRDHTLKPWVAIDPEGAVIKAYRIQFIPRCALVDRTGNVRKWCHTSELTEADIQALLDE